MPQVLTPGYGANAQLGDLLGEIVERLRIQQEPGQFGVGIDDRRDLEIAGCVVGHLGQLREARPGTGSAGIRARCAVDPRHEGALGAGERTPSYRVKRPVRRVCCGSGCGRIVGG
jgi:hypothetical protein